MYRIRLIIYEILTLLIMILGRLREKICFPTFIFKHRTFLIPEEWIQGFGYIDTCCDCGLSHRVFLRKKGLFSHPLRPKGYSYTLRTLRKSSPLYKGKIE